MMRSKELKTSRSILVLVLWFSLCTVLAISVWRCSNCIQRKQLQSLWPRMSLQVDSSHMIVLQDAILGMVHYYFNILRSAPNQDPHQVAESTSKNPWEHREHMYIQITRVELQHLLPPQTHRESISIQITREICFSISCICWFWFGFCVCRTSFPTWLKIKRNRISVSTNLKFCSSGPIMTITTAVQTSLPVRLKNHTDSMTAIFQFFWEWYLWCGRCMVHFLLYCESGHCPCILAMQSIDGVIAHINDTNRYTAPERAHSCNPSWLPHFNHSSIGLFSAPPSPHRLSDLVFDSQRQSHGTTSKNSSSPR